VGAAVRTAGAHRYRCSCMTPGLPSGSYHEDVVGLDIGDSTITAARVAWRRNGEIELRNVGWVDYDPDASDRQIAMAIRKLWHEYHITTFTTCSCLRSRSLTLKYFRYPDMSEDEIGSALLLEAEETLQLSQDEMVLDWNVNHKANARPDVRNETDGVFVAASRRDVDRHLAILEMAGLYPIVLDVACMAVSNLFLALGKRDRDNQVECVISLAGRYVDLAILFDEGCIYPRTVLSRSAAWEEAAESLIANVKDVLKFYQFKLRQRPVQKLTLCGHVPSREKFLARVRESVGLPVEF